MNVDLKKYPTTEEVENASHSQLCRWYRFLPSPGTAAMELPYEEFKKALDDEAKIITRICDRMGEKGGMTTEISKRIGFMVAA